MKTLVRGQKLKLSEISASKQFVVGLNLEAPSLVLDASCFGLDANGILADEQFFVFYNQTSAPGEAIKLLGAQAGDANAFWVDLNRLPTSIARLVFVVSVDGVGALHQIGNSYLRILASAGGANRWNESARFTFTGNDFNSERALMVAEIYRKDEWRFAAVGQGFSGGLDAVLSHFGGQVADTPPAGASPTPQPIPTPPARFAPPTAPPPSSWSPTAGSPSTPAVGGANLRSPDVPRAPDGKNCTRCGDMISFWEKTTGRYNATTGRCANCEKIVAEQQRAAVAAREAAMRSALHRVKSIFAGAWLDGTLDVQTWRATQSAAHAGGLSPDQLRDAIWPDAKRQLENLVAMSAADGIITSEEETAWKQTLQLLALPGGWTAPIEQRFAREKLLSQIRQGNLPHVADAAHGLHLESGETCHMVAPAQFVKVLASGRSLLPVTLVATNKKLYVLEQNGGGRELSYAKFLRVVPEDRSVTLELSVKTGAGTYYTEDGAHVDAVLTTLVRLSKRQLVRETPESRHVPHHIKTSVWARDAGKCVECGANSYLEYDHIIPHSKGGANSLANIRLLCRRCNLAKGDRI